MTKKRFGRKLLSILITVLLALTFPLPCLATEARSGKAIRVGFYEYAPFQHIAMDGALSGYSYDYLQALAQYTGWNYEFVTTESMTECLELLRKGEIDLMGTLRKTPEQEAIYGYPETASGWSMSYLVTAKHNTAYAFEDFEAFDGMTVALQKDLAHNAGLFSYCKGNGFSVQTVEVEDEKSLQLALQGGTVDAALISSEQIRPDQRIIAKFDYNNVYYVTTMGNVEVLQQLNRAINQLMMNHPNFVSSLYEKYYSTQTGIQAVFSKEELAYIKSQPTIKILFDPDWPPFEALDTEKLHADGITIDLAKRMFRISGLRFEFLPTDSFTQALLRFKAGQADVFASMVFDFNWANQNNAYLTQPYVDIPTVTIYKTELTSDRRLALPKGRYMTQLMEKKNPNAEILYFDTVADCINAVEQGDADYTFVNSYEADYYLSMPRYQTLKFRTLQATSQQLSFAVSKNADPVLYSILTKSLNSISSETLASIIRDHTSRQEKHGFFSMLYTSPLQFMLICGLLLVLLIVILLVLLFSRTLKAKNTALQQVLTAKSDFLSRMSHDMRTPMNAILGLSHLGGESKILEECTEYHQRVHAAADYLLGLINDTLDMSKFDSGKMTLHLEPYDVSELITALSNLFEQKAAERQVKFSIQLHADKSYIALLDPLRIQQIFVNLINNAIKFTPSGGCVEFIVSISSKTAQQLSLQFVVRDSGIGISKAFQERMFEPFEQEHQGNTSGESGTGLGLSIVKRLVDLMDGTLSVKSKVGKGSEFRISLTAGVAPPVTSDQQTKQALNTHPLLSGKRILLCEDHPLNAQIATKLLEKKGVLVEHAENGQIAVEYFCRSTPDYYDAILMDIHMPLLNGLEATTKIRTLTRNDAQRIPIIAMTANAFEDDIQKSFAAGMTAHLSKPVVPQRLYQIICEQIANAEA